jgi:hypothetical protein
MDNQQESLQFKILMDNVNLNDLKLHKKYLQTSEEKRNFIYSYGAMSTSKQYEYLQLGRGIVSKMRQQLVNYFKTLPIPNGFKHIPIDSNHEYLADELGNILRENDRILVKTILDDTGYYRVSVTHTRPNGTIIDYDRVHRLMAITYLNNIDNKRTINHIDGNKLNNNISNLEWATDYENQKHAIGTGLRKMEYLKNPRPCRRKLSEEQILNIYSTDKNISHASIARQYNVSETTIAYIRKNKL